METFPNKLTDEPERLEAGLGDLGNAALQELAGRGYEVAAGLNEYYAGAISVMARQEHIVEYCPGDATDRRFATLESTEKWLQKAGGRAVFLLLQRSAGEPSATRLAGYGWTGYEEAPRFGAYPVTSAYRLGDIALNQGLYAHYVQAVVSATKRLFTAEGLGLETWQTNWRATRVYKERRFYELGVDPEESRPSLLADDGMVLDSRVYMGYAGE